jgi:hypothetical protein
MTSRTLSKFAPLRRTASCSDDVGGRLCAPKVRRPLRWLTPIVPAEHPFDGDQEGSEALKGPPQSSERPCTRRLYEETYPPAQEETHPRPGQPTGASLDGDVLAAQGTCGRDRSSRPAQLLAGTEPRRTAQC